MEDLRKYEHIINLPHHQSQSRPQMSMAERAAQFSPFATLTGHGEAIFETERLTEQQTALTEEEARHLSDETGALMMRLAAGERPAVAVTYFRPDERKAGGSYETCEGRLRRIDEIGGVFHMMDGTRVEMRQIARIRAITAADEAGVHPAGDGL